MSAPMTGGYIDQRVATEAVARGYTLEHVLATLGRAVTGGLVSLRDLDLVAIAEVGRCPPHDQGEPASVRTADDAIRTDELAARESAAMIGRMQGRW